MNAPALFGASPTETTEAQEGKGLFAVLPPAENNERPQPPVRTKTWFHLGIVRHDTKFRAAYEKEQWRPTATAGQSAPPVSLLERPALLEELAGDPTDVQWHEAMRAMRGQTLRAEVYGLDGGPNDDVPVQVSETRARVKQLQAPRGGKGATARHAVMFVHGEEAVTIHHEKDPDDPRVAHTLTLEVDPYGVVTPEATVVYGRKPPPPAPPPPAPPPPPVEIFSEQTTTHVVIGTRQVTHFSDGSTYRLAVPLAEQAYELRMPAAPAGDHGLYTHTEIQGTFTIPDNEVPYEATPAPEQKRLLGSAIHRYYNATLTGPLTDGTANEKALPYESCALSFTPGLLAEVYSSKVDAALLLAAGYEDRGTAGFWTRSGREVYDPAHFYLPTEVLDPFGRVTTLTYDPKLLFVTEVSDPLGNIMLEYWKILTTGE